MNDLPPRARRAVVAGIALAALAAALAGLGIAAWCDDLRFGFFLEARPAPPEVPAIDFTLDDEATYPDVHRALRSVGAAVRAEDAEAARGFLARMTEENVAAVRVANGSFFLIGIEQGPGPVWQSICS